MRKTTSSFHPNNKHQGKYDFEKLALVNPDLSEFIAASNFGNKTIDFHNPEAVKNLNLALLKHFYKIKFWEIPDNYLCPPIPGRADHLHYLSDVLSEFNNGKIPKGADFQCLDIGVGANCIYPIIGRPEFGWSFVGSEIDDKAIQNAQEIIKKNEHLKGRVELRHQKNERKIFRGIIQNNDYFDLTISNPPFHNSWEEANEQNFRKNKNLNGKDANVKKNFGGRNHELWCEGGELKFIKTMILESKIFGHSCFLFSTLVSKEANLPKLESAFKKTNPTFFKTLSIQHGNKKSRILVWSFLNKKKMEIWRSMKWG